MSPSSSSPVAASDTRIFDVMTFECVARLSDERRLHCDGFQHVCVSGARVLRAASGKAILSFPNAVTT